MSRMPVQLPIRDSAQRRAWHGIAGHVAAVAAVFCLLLSIMLMVTFIRDRAGNPLAASTYMLSKQPAPADADPLVKQLCDLQQRVREHPEDDNLTKQFRQVDKQMRQRHFDRRQQMVFGSWLLIGGMLTLLLSLKARSQFSATPPGVITVFAPSTDWRLMARYGQYAIAAVGGVTIVALVVFALRTPATFPVLMTATTLPGRTPAATSPVLTLVPPTPEFHAQWLRNWPCFRGPSGCGLTYNATPPKEWDGTTGHNILWKVPVPLKGQNSPIIWEDHLYLSGATATKQMVFCYSTADGKLLWQEPVGKPGSEEQAVEVNDDTGYAAPTMACDGQRVFAIFATGDIAAFDFAGNQIWSKNLGRPVSQYGHASSLTAYGSCVIVQFDQDPPNSDPPTSKSALLALDSATGNVVWSTRREVSASWTSPIVIFPASGPQIITAARPLVVAYKPEDGKEIWSASVLDGDVAPSPAFANDLVYVANQQAKLSAIRIDGHGDVSSTHVAWTGEEGMPDISSPLATDHIVLLVQGNGPATCYDAKSGKQLWDHDFTGAFHASPVLVDKTIYLIDREGVTHMFADSAEFKELGTCPLGEAVSASPAFVGSRIYIRASENLYCIGGQ